jgi:ATP-binding cassette subfamily F protein 3
MNEIDRVAPNMLPAETRHYLAKFLFTGDEVFRRVGTLSGGERGRLALAKLALSDANLLLLDEPTNHLDLHTQEVLESVLSAFSGTILLVSHDRYLIDSLASQIWEVDPAEGTLHAFKGSYTQYKAHKIKLQEAKTQAESEQTSPVEAGRPGSASPTGSKGKRESKGEEIKPPSKYERRQMRARLEAIEKEIRGLETRQETLSVRLENPPEDSAEVLRLGEEYVALQEQVEALLAEWSQLEDRLST